MVISMNKQLYDMYADKKVISLSSLDCTFKVFLELINYHYDEMIEQLVGEAIERGDLK